MTSPSLRTFWRPSSNIGLPCGTRTRSSPFAARHGGHLAPSTLKRYFYAARVIAGRPDLRFHDLRHTGATLAAATGASLAELMGRPGHGTPAAALRYQHVAADRDQVIAELLSSSLAAEFEHLARRDAT